MTPRRLLAALIFVPLVACSAQPSATPLPTTAAMPAASESQPPLVVPTVPPATPAPTVAPAAEGWTRHTVAAEGLTLDLPAGWQAVDLTSGDVDALVDQMIAANPDQAAMWEQAKAAIDQGMVFMAFDTAAAQNTSFATNVNILRLDAGGLLEYAVAESEAALESTFGGDVITSIETMPFGEVGVLRYHLDYGSLDNDTLQYYVIRGSRSYVITFSYVGDTEPAEFAQAMQTLTLAD